MKNSVFKKFMAMALAATLAVSTPLLASAAGIGDAYDEVTEGTESGTGSSTGTASGTSTGFTKLEEGKNGILGIAFDKTDVELEVVGDNKGSETLQARLAFENADTEEITLANGDKVDREAVNGFIKYEIVEKQVSYAPEKGESPIEINRLKTDLSKINVKAIKAGSAKIVASIDVDQDGVADFSTEAEIKVKEYASDVDINVTNKLYLGHTYDLNQYTKLTLGGEQVNAADSVEYVTYSATTVDESVLKAKDVAKYVTINDAGNLTVKKIPANGAIKVIATTEKGYNDSSEITLDAGVQATAVEIKHISDDVKRTDKKNNASKAAITLDPTATDTNYIADVELTLVNKPKNGETKTTDNGREEITDYVVWTTAKSSIADVTDSEENDLKATIEANGEGSTTITATAYPSKKKATISVKVTATPTGLELHVDQPQIYTGQKIEVGYTVKTGAKDITIKKKPAFSFSKEDKAFASITGKGLVTAKNLLAEKVSGKTEYKDDVTVTVNAELKVSSSIKIPATQEIKIKQSSINDIDITNVTNNVVAYTHGNRNGADTLNVRANNEPYKYDATVYGADGKAKEDQSEAASITWAMSGKQASVDYDGCVTALSAGKPTLKASFVTVTTNNNGKKSAKLVTKQVKLNVIQHATSLALNKTEQIANNIDPTAGTLKKDATFTFSVKAQLPKGSKDAIEWKLISNDDKITINNARISGSLSNTIKVTVPAGTPVGTVVKVGAYTASGAVSYGYIYVTTKTLGVEIQDPVEGSIFVDPVVQKNGQVKYVNNQKTVEVGDSFKMDTKVILVKKTSKAPAVLGEAGEGGIAGTSTQYYVNEPVTYTVDKKGAGVVKIEADGTVTALKAGTATITAKTITGKSAKIKVVVK